MLCIYKYIYIYKNDPILKNCLAQKKATFKLCIASAAHCYKTFSVGTDSRRAFPPFYKTHGEMCQFTRSAATRAHKKNVSFFFL